VKSGDRDLDGLPLCYVSVEISRRHAARLHSVVRVCAPAARIGYVHRVTVLEGQEIELKLEFDPADLGALQRSSRIRELSVGRAVTRQLRSVYFDTPDLELAASGIGLRVRTVGRRRIQTVKTRGGGAAGLFVRGEFESPVAGSRPDLEAVSDPELRARLRTILAGKTLAPIFETDMRRSRRVLRDGVTEWTCDIDVGEVRTATASAPICELELELRQGDPARLYDLALALLDSAALRPGTQTKADLGYALLTGVRPGPRKAGPIVCEGAPDLEALIEAVVRSCLDQIASNALPAWDGEDPEGVHQMRVGVRRLRSALSVFKRVLPALHLERLRGELKWLGGELGQARDLDVFTEEFLEPIFRVRCQDPALKRLRDEAQTMRREAQDRVREAIRSPRYTRLMLDLGRWLARAEWRDQPLSASSALLFQPAEGFAQKLLAKQRRRARRLGRDLANAPIETKHALRIQLKKLRYASEFFRGLFPARDARRYISRLSKLQDSLGHLNDVATAERQLSRILEHLAGEKTAEHERAAGFVEGWAARDADRGDRRLLKLWSDFEDVRPFWKAER
jgi:inorganic triphosphatase YgiF